MKKTLLTTAVVLAVTGCGGGSGSSSSSSSSSTNSDGETLSSVATGYALPTEISAVPSDSDSTATGVMMTGLMSRLVGVASSLPESSDYNEAKTKKYVEERALEQFDIIEQVMNALAQTHYSKQENLNAGPYTAMVAWVDEQDGREIKQLQPWVVDSRMIVENGQDVNRVLVWIEEPDRENPGETELVRAEFKIYQSATVNADGSFADYGEWDMNVSFEDPDANGLVDDYFAASSTIDANGVNRLSIHERFPENMEGTEFVYELKGVLVRSGATGHGRVQFPDWDVCFGPDSDPNCTPPTKTAQYAYNADYVVVDDDTGTNGTDDAKFKDRDPGNAVEFTHRYGLYHASADADNGIAAGDSVEKHESFGFPLRFTDSNGMERHAYYGAWQGRHEIWGGDDLSQGDTVTRDDRGPNQTAETYTVSKSFNGTLTKRTLADGSLDDIKGINVETWVNKHYDLFYNGAASEWQSCSGWVDFMQNPPVCMDKNGNASSFTTFTDFGSLVQGGEADRKEINIGTWDDATQTEKNYVYLASDPGTVNWTGAGFYEAERDQQTGRLSAVTNADRLAPQDGDNLWVDISGSLYIQYNGDFTNGATGWVQRSLSSFDEETWTPTFDANGDQPFSPEVGRDYYINSRGSNYVVKRKSSTDAASSYEVKMELQSAANPVNAGDIIPTGTAYFRTPWRPEIRFTFDTDSTSSSFLQLVYANDDPNTDGDDTGNVYTNGEWGLQAYTDNGTPNDTADDQPLMADGTAVAVDEWGFPTNPDQRPVEFNWEYSEDGWGTQKYLIDPSTTEYVLLSDPIQLQPVTLTNGAGQSKTLALQFDGWMHGLPDLYYELSKNNWQMSQEISDKVVSIPEGTEVTDANSVSYYVKPLEISVFLDEVTASEITNAGGTAPDISDADSLDLSTVPDFTDHGMGAKPTDTEVKYSEGKDVSS